VSTPRWAGDRTRAQREASCSASTDHRGSARTASVTSVLAVAAADGRQVFRTTEDQSDSLVPLATVADQAGTLTDWRESGQGDSVARPECSIPRCVAPHRQEFGPTAVARRHTPSRPIGSPSLTNRSRIERCSTRPGEPHPRGDDVIARGTGPPDRTANRRRRNGDKAIRASARPAPSDTLTQSRQRRAVHVTGRDLCPVKCSPAPSSSLPRTVMPIWAGRE
jgi:hypothetical protein